MLPLLFPEVHDQLLRIVDVEGRFPGTTPPPLMSSVKCLF